MAKIYYVNFQTHTLDRVEEIEQKEQKLDPVLERVKAKMSPENFKIFKAYVDAWMDENFKYQMEQVNLKGEKWHFQSND